MTTRNYRILLGAAITAGTVLQLSRAPATPLPSISDALKSYDRACKLPFQVSYEEHEISKVRLVKEPARTFDSTVELCRNGDLFDFTRSQRRAQEGTLPAVHYSREIIWNDQYVEINRSGRSQTSTYESMGNLATERGQLLETCEGQMAGRFPALGGQRLSSVALGNSDKFHVLPAETIDGVACVVVSGSTEYGKMTVWLDPKSAYAALKFRLEQVAHDRSDDQTLFEATSSPGEPNSGYVHSTIECDARLGSFDGMYLPISAHIKWRAERQDGQVSTSDNTFERSKLSIHPDYVALNAFRVDIPEGSLISADNDSGIQYEWRTGRVVPHADSATVSDIDRLARDLRATTQNGETK